GPAGAPVIAGYELLGPIGRGGMGTVWEAVELRFERHVAIKVHTQTAEHEDDAANDAAELFREAKVAAKLGDPGIVRVLDFGVASRMGHLTNPQLMQGSPYYMAPEQWLNAELGPQTDVYAIGSMLYEMIAGRRANQASGLADVYTYTLEREPEPLSTRV